MKVQRQSASGIAMDKSSQSLSPGWGYDQQVVTLPINFVVDRFNKMTKAFIKGDAFVIYSFAHK